MNLDRLTAELILDEGRRSKPYEDQFKNITIGIGRNLTAKGLSVEEQDFLFKNDVDEAQRLLDTYLPWWRQLDEVRQRVMVNMTFNMGLAPMAPVGKRGLWEFHRTILLVQTGSYSAAAAEMLLSEWANQVGVRAKRLSDKMRAGTPGG